ncbi:MAG: X-Pro aminopeptidase [Flavobacteriaceae bacterium]|nr:X-Pro aminopeptidase [Flavobacteriaceae bacterium]
MRYKSISSHIYKKNRGKFMSRMKKNSFAVFNSNDIYPIGADSTFPFEQHRDIFYLTGIDQEETILLLSPQDKEIKNREILFVKETDKNIQIWEGPKLSKEDARSISGIEKILWLNEFEPTLKEITSQNNGIYLNKNEHYRNNSETQTREDRFISKFKKEYPTHSVYRSNPILQHIRSIKDPLEINQIKKACDITEMGFRRILKFIKPGIWEYEIEAELLHEFISNRSKGFAYSPIIASGKNANILHYIKNNSQCKSGELILIDAAAEYGNYCSDLTRTIPVSGRYSVRQKAIYNAVLNVKREATTLLTPGNLWKEYHEEVGKIMTAELLKLGLLDKNDVRKQDPKNPAYKKYFMHGTSHHIGLDTHDYGLLNEPFEPNMVFTVEPGIYLPDEGFGIRIEDVVVVQESGDPINLMKNIPIEIDEIESIMNS